MTDLLLYSSAHSGYCSKVRIVLRVKGMAWREEPPPGGYRSAEYRALVPAGNLPALRHGDLLLADSEAIVEYLNDLCPFAPLLPCDVADRARMRARGRFHDTRLEPALRALYPHVRPGARDAGMAARQSVEISQRLDEAARLIAGADHLGFGLGDCGYPATFAWIEALTPVLDLRIDWPPALSGWRERIESHPAVAAEMATFRPEIGRWLASVGAVKPESAAAADPA